MSRTEAPSLEIIDQSDDKERVEDNPTKLNIIDSIHCEDSINVVKESSELPENGPSIDQTINKDIECKRDTDNVQLLDENAAEHNEISSLEQQHDADIQIDERIEDESRNSELNEDQILNDDIESKQNEAKEILERDDLSSLSNKSPDADISIDGGSKTTSPLKEEFLIDDQNSLEVEALIEEQESEEDQAAEILLEIEAEGHKELVEKYKEMMTERSTLRIRNKLLNKKLVDFFKFKEISCLKDSGDLQKKDNCYYELLTNYDKMVDEGEAEIQKIKESIRNSESTRDKCLKKCTDEFQSLQRLIKKSASGLTYLWSKNPLSEKVIEKSLSKLQSKMQNLSEVRLEYIRLRNVVNCDDNKLKSHSLSLDSQKMINYGKLRDENQVFEKKIEECNDTLERLEKRCMEHQQILAHIQEKVDVLVAQCALKESKLHTIDAELNQAREQLNETKSKITDLKKSFEHKEKVCGYILNEKLLKDYAKSVDLAAKLKNQRDSLQKEVTVQHEAIKKSLVKKKTAPPEKVIHIRPRFHKSAILRPSIDLL